MAERTLYRSVDDRMIGGVCAGIADYFHLDPTVVRLIAVLAAALSGGGMIIVYLILWAAVPEQPASSEGVHAMSDDTNRAHTGASGEGSSSGAPTPPASPPYPPPAPPVQPVHQSVPPVSPAPPQAPPRPPGTRGRGPIWIGLALVFIGVVLLAQMFVPGVRLWEFWPVILIVWGLFVIFRPRGRD